MIGRTVVAWDGSEPAKVALEWALSRERDRDGTVVLVYVVGDSKVVVDYLPTEPKLAKAYQLVEAEATRVRREDPDVTLNTQVRWGDPVDELVRITHSDGVVIVGTSQSAGGRGYYKRSLGARLAARAHGPVIVVPVGTSSRERAGIFVGIEGTDSDKPVLTFAAREALRHGETLHLVHAWPESSVRHKGAVADDRVEARSTAQAVLDQTVKILHDSYGSLSVRTHLVSEEPARALLTLAGSAALLVVGSRQRRGVARAWRGSASRAVLIDIICPTAVIPSEEDD